MKIPLFVMLALLLPDPLLAQQSLLVADQGSRSAFQPAHTGEIRFSAAAIATGGEAEADYIGLNTYVLSLRSKLFLTAFQGISLTSALHRLAPHVPLNELARSGTYQFSFYVDGQLVYLTILPPGAVPIAIRNDETVLHQAFINPGEPAREWGPLLWDQFLAHGGIRALAQGQHLLRIELRPYFQNPALRDAPVLAAGQVALDVAQTLAPRSLAR